MNDLLDDRLRTMMRTATADAPEAPTVDDLQVITVVGAEPRRRGLRPMAAAAAVMAVAAAGALVWWPSGDGGTDPADLPETTDAIAPGSYLDAYYLPTDLPDGWQIVQMERFESHLVQSGDRAVFETRDGKVRAEVAQELSGSDSSPATTAAEEDPATGSTTQAEPVPTSAATASWDARDSLLSWRQDGRMVWLTPSDGIEASARSLAEELVMSRIGSRVTFRVPDDASWVQTAEYLLDGNTVVSSGENSLSLADETRGVVYIGISRPNGPRAEETGAPVPDVDGIYRRVDFGANTLVRAAGDVEISAFSHDGSAGTDELVSLLQSLAPVSEEEWLAARPDPNEFVAEAAVVGTFELLDHTITAHRDGAVSGVCVERSDGVSGCAFRTGVEPDGELPPAAPTEGIRLSDGSWVAVGSIANGLEPCDEPLLQGARTAVVPNGDVQTMLVVPADQDVSFACPLSGTPEGGPTGAEVFIANPPRLDD